jgi:hypothetical protein
MTTTPLVQSGHSVLGVRTTTTTSTVVADYSALGEFIADASSDDQADFLAGFALAFRAQRPKPVAGLMQLQHLADALIAEPDSAAVVGWLLTELANRIDVPVAA